MINFSIYRSWEPYDVVPKHSLVDWIDKENLPMEFTANIFDITQYLISSILDPLKRKCDWYITRNI
jgi:hypothetical protein